MNFTANSKGDERSFTHQCRVTVNHGHNLNVGRAPLVHEGMNEFSTVIAMKFPSPADQRSSKHESNRVRKRKLECLHSQRAQIHIQFQYQPKRRFENLQPEVHRHCE